MVTLSRIISGYLPSNMIGCANHPRLNCMLVLLASWSAPEAGSRGSAQCTLSVIPQRPPCSAWNSDWYRR